MSRRTYTREEKIAQLRIMIKEAAVEARAERDGDKGYKHALRNAYAGDWFDGFEQAQRFHRKSLAEAILHTDAATFLDEVL